MCLDLDLLPVNLHSTSGQFVYMTKASYAQAIAASSKMEGHDQAVAPIFLLVLLFANATFGAYQSAGCSDEGCGIPCYLRPAGDTCHYTRDDSASCCNGSGDYLKKELWTLNSTLIRLQNKLIQKGISEDKII